MAATGAADEACGCVNEFALWKALDADVDVWRWPAAARAAIGAPGAIEAAIDDEPRPLAGDVVAVATIVPLLSPLV